MKGLFLDDERQPLNAYWVEYPNDVEWTIVRNYEEFVAAVSNSEFDLISFDHDLGTDKSGYDCVKYFTEQHQQGLIAYTPKMYFHTQNPVGRNNMSMVWNRYKYNKQRGRI